MTTDILLHSNIPLLKCEPLVIRERCFNFLDQSFTRPLLFINGGQGCGKSVLIQSYLEELQIPTIFIHLESGKEHLPIFLDTTSKGLSLFSQTRIDSDEIDILGKLSTWKKRLAIVLDCEKNTEPDRLLLDYLLQLVQHCPRSVHFVIISRIRPNLPYVKLKAQGLAMEFKKSDLYFQADEICDFFRLSGLTFEEKDSQEIFQFTNGWALCLPYLAEEWRDVPKNKRNFSYSSVTELLEEVFKEELDSNRLLPLSVLHELNSKTIRFLPDPLPEEHWRYLTANSFFLQKKEDESFQFIPLIRKYLYQTYLQAKGNDELNALHLRIASHYESQFQYYYAFAHNLAASQYSEAARQMQVMMNFYTPERFLLLIDGTLEEICPSISFSTFSMFLFRCIPIPVLKSYVPGLEKALHELEKQGISKTLIYLQHRLGLIHFYSGDVQCAKDLFFQSLTSSEQLESHEFTIINLSLLAQCCRFEGKLAEGIAYARRALSDIESWGSYDAHMHTVWILTELLLEQGEIALAEPIFSELMKLSDLYHDEAARIYPLMAKAKFCRLKGDLKEALKIGDMCLAQAENFHIDPDLGWICLEMGLIHQSRSDTEQANRYFVRSAENFKHYTYFHNLVSQHINDSTSKTKQVTEQTSEMLTIQLLGPLNIVSHGQELKLQRKSSLQLLIYLAVNYHKKLPKDLLLEELFPESNYESQNNRFYVSLSSLRKGLEPNLKSGRQSSYILQSGELFYLNQKRCLIDLSTFEGLSALQDGDPEERISQLLQAERLYKGDLLEEYPYEAFLEPVRERVKQDYLQLLREIGLYYWNKKDYLQGIQYFDRILEKDQFAESVYWEYIQLLLKQDLIQNAKQIAGKMLKTLEQELGIPVKQRLQNQFPQLSL